tara:strand:+ start:40 stop:426 length:387 start_codon:yes stop_codon:yes gene_type:complete
MSQNLAFTFNKKINISAQVGDNVYAVTPTGSGGFNKASLASCKFVGVITSVQNTDTTKRINVFQDLATSYIPAGPTATALGEFIMFSKNKQVNTSGISGYYAEVEFKNDSKTHAELFSVGSQVSLSSK